MFNSLADQHEPRCQPGTRVNLLTEIYKWIDSPTGKCIFWLRGMAGTGKSTISRSVAEYIVEKKVPTASYFFKKGEGDRGGAAMFFTTIANQLASQLPVLRPYIQAAIENDLTLVHRAMEEQYDKLILKPLHECGTRPNSPVVVVVVVDALDECDREDDAKAIIRLLSKASKALPVCLRFFVTSRPELPIRLGFADIQRSYEHLALHEAPKSEITEDISTFLSFRLAQIRDEYNKTVPGSTISSVWPTSAHLQSLVNMSVPLFIFASTACLFIGDRRLGHPEQQLEQILKSQGFDASQLHMVYLPILDQLLGSHIGKRKGDIITRFNNIVGAIVTLADPLSIASLARLLGKSEGEIVTMLDGLHSVLDIPSDPASRPVKLLHLSFRDFLVDEENREGNSFWVDAQNAHQNLASQCLRLLDENLRMDICNLQMPGTSRTEVHTDTIDSRLPPDVQYACRYWVHHLEESKKPIQDDDEAYVFLTHHFLHWLEAMCLLGRLSESISMMQVLCLMDVSIILGEQITLYANMSYIESK